MDDLTKLKIAIGVVLVIVIYLVIAFFIASLHFFAHLVVLLALGVLVYVLWRLADEHRFQKKGK